jgi:hypothetical protein
MYRLIPLLPITHILFFVLLGAGWYLGRLTGRWLLIIGLLWTGGLLLRSMPVGPPLFNAVVAVLDIVLVLRVVGRDVTLP